MDRFDGGYEVLDNEIIANITEEEYEVDRIWGRIWVIKHHTCSPNV